MKVAIPVRFEKIPDLDLVGKLVLLSSFAGFLDGGEARNDLRAIKSNPGDDLAVPYGRLSPIGRNRQDKYLAAQQLTVERWS